MARLASCRRIFFLRGNAIRALFTRREAGVLRKWMAISKNARERARWDDF